jgi:hypothetical protein
MLGKQTFTYRREDRGKRRVEAMALTCIEGLSRSFMAQMPVLNSYAIRVSR